MIKSASPFTIYLQKVFISFHGVLFGLMRRHFWLSVYLKACNQLIAFSLRFELNINNVGSEGKLVLRHLLYTYENICLVISTTRPSCFVKTFQNGGRVYLIISRQGMTRNFISLKGSNYVPFFFQFGRFPSDC